MKVVPLVVVGLALLVAVRAQDEESQESKDAAEAMKWYRVAAESGMDGKIWDKHKLRVVA